MRLNLCSGKGNQGSAATHVRAGVIVEAVSAYRSCRAFSGMAKHVWGYSLLGVKKGGRHPFDSEVSSARGLVKPGERVKGDPVAALYSCLKESHKDGRTKACVVAAGLNGKWQQSQVATWEVQVEHEEE